MPKDQQIILNSKTRDSSSKIIFDDPILCSQFLRDYVEDVPCLRTVRPEDIEDVSDQYVPLFAEERNADRVKKVNIKNDVPFFLISLIEHKTKVEYNVCMQIFRYMIYIWEAYEKEAESMQKGITRQKEFKYPPILPIVYYEGKQKWTVPLHFKSRIMKGESFVKYIPDFQYCLVPLRDYSSQELLEKEDEISLLMLINRMQTEEDVTEFRNLPVQKLQSILKSTPEHLVNIISDVLLAFLLKANLSVDEAEEVVGRLREKNMGQLFENMDPIDIPARRKELAEKMEKVLAHERRIQEDQRKMQEDQRKIQEDQRKVQEDQRKVQEDIREAQEIRKKAQKDIQEAQEIRKKAQEDIREAQEIQSRAQEQRRKNRADIQKIKEEQNKVREERRKLEMERRKLEEMRGNSENTSPIA